MSQAYVVEVRTALHKFDGGSSHAAPFFSQMLVYVRAPANATCSDLAVVIRKFSEVLHLRVLDRAPEDVGVEDLGAPWLQQMAKRECPKHLAFALPQPRFASHPSLDLH